MRNFDTTGKRRASETHVDALREAANKRSRKDEAAVAGTSAAPQPASVRANPVPAGSDWVEMNVGGKPFLTTKQTLTTYGDSTLATLAAPESYGFAPRAPNEILRIDRSGKLFAHVLDYLRNGKLARGLSPSVVDGIALEAAYFGLDRLYTDAKHLYGVREQKRAARNDAANPTAYATAYAKFVKQVLLHSEDAKYTETKLLHLIDIWRTDKRTYTPLPADVPPSHQRYAEYNAALFVVNADLCKCFEEKIELLEKAKSFNSKWPFVDHYLNRARDLLESQNLMHAALNADGPEQERLMRRAISMRPPSSADLDCRFHTDLTEIFEAEGRWEEAVECLQEALQRYPILDPMTHIGVAENLRLLKRPLEALPFLLEGEKFVSDEDEWCYIRSVYVETLRDSHQFHEAEAACRQITKRCPSEIGPRILLLNCLTDTQQYEQLCKDAEEAMRRLPDTRDDDLFQNCYGDALVAQNRFNEAAAVYSRLATRSNDLLLLTKLLNTFGQLHRWGAAESALVASRYNNRELAWGHLTWANILRQNGKHNEAARHIQRAHTLDPTVNTQSFLSSES